MKKKISLFIATTLVVSLIFYSCSKTEGEGVAPTYKSQASTTGNNPNSTTTSTTTGGGTGSGSGTLIVSGTTYNLNFVLGTPSSNPYSYGVSGGVLNVGTPVIGCNLIGPTTPSSGSYTINPNSIIPPSGTAIMTLGLTINGVIESFIPASSPAGTANATIVSGHQRVVFSNVTFKNVSNNNTVLVSGDLTCGN